MITIYKTINLINGKFYIGQRLSSGFNNYYGSGRLIKQAIKKYGKENFIVEVLDYAYSSDESDEKELFWIQEENSLVPNGYNISLGGNNGKYGTKHSVETKRKISMGNKGKIISEEHKEILSILRKTQRSPAAKLTDDQVGNIRELYNTNKIPYRKLAKMFNTNRNTICCIVNNKLYQRIN